MNMKVTPHANAATATATAGAQDSASGFFGQTAGAGHDSASSFHNKLRQASLSLATGKHASSKAAPATGSSNAGTTATHKQESAGQTERGGQAVHRDHPPAKHGDKQDRTKGAPIAARESSAGKKSSKQEKDKKSAPPSGNRTLYAAVIVTGTVGAKGTAVASTQSETNDTTGKTRKGATTAAPREAAAEVQKNSDANAEPAKRAATHETPANATWTGANAAAEESTKQPEGKERGKPEVTTTTGSSEKPADVSVSASGANNTPVAATPGTKTPETQASAHPHAMPSATGVSKAAASVTATGKESGVQATATTTAADPPNHGKNASKATGSPLDPGRAGAATGAAAVTTATAAANTAKPSGGGADSRAWHGDTGKNGNSAPKDQAGARQKEAGARSTTSGPSGSAHTVKESQATSATAVKPATNASASAAGHTGNSQSAAGQSGSALTTTGHDAPVAHAETGQLASADSGISRIQNARLIRSASRAEMRVQLETSQLGPVQLRASVAGSRIGATITVDRPETQWLLASKLGVLHQALNDRNLQVDRIDVVSGSGTNTGGQTGTGTSNGGGRAWQQNSGHSWTGTTPQMPTEATAEEITTTSSVIRSYQVGRLSVRA